MAQIWLTYGELADFMRLRLKDVETASISASWDRRVSRDGATRVRLPPAIALDYMVAVVAEHAATQMGGLTALSGRPAGAGASKALNE